MTRTLLLREILPLMLAFAGLVVAMLLLDALLHALELAWIGRYLGIPGVLLILLSLRYSLRKHGYTQIGNPARLLRLHKWLAWFGSLLVLVHGGVHFHALLPWLATVAMLVNVVSGLTGTFLVNRGLNHLKQRREQLQAAGLSGDEIESRLLPDVMTVGLMRKWRVVHLPIALTFAVLALAHIISILLFWGWR